MGAALLERPLLLKYVSYSNFLVSDQVDRKKAKKIIKMCD